MKHLSAKVVVSAAAIALAATLGLAACSNSSSSTTSSDTGTADTTTEEETTDEAGFEELPIGEEEVFPLNISTVYFQPVDMSPAGMGLSAAESNFHLEADISALADNKLGYGTGDFVPDLTVEYAIVDRATGENVVSGTFMQMNASDGPHYGANVALPNAGEYQLKLTIYSPEQKGWMLHTDAETGVTGTFWTEPIEVAWDWDYTPQEW